MDIQVNHNDVTGSYFYTKERNIFFIHGKVETYSVNGKLHNKESMDLKVLDQKGNTIALFKGFPVKLTVYAQGKWINQVSGEELPFHLSRVCEYVFINIRQGLRISETTIYPFFLSPSNSFKEIGQIVRNHVLCEQRKFIDDARNDYIDDLNTYHSQIKPNDFGSLDYCFDWESYLICSLIYYSNTIVSLKFEDYQFTGGAHGMTYTDTMNFNVKSNGKVILLKLRDLLLADSGYKKLLSRLIIKALKKQGASYVLNGQVKDIKNIDSLPFLISNQGIHFFFAPYEMGPYCQGTFDVIIPYEDIESVIDKAKLKINP